MPVHALAAAHLLVQAMDLTLQLGETQTGICRVDAAHTGRPTTSSLQDERDHDQADENGEEGNQHLHGRRLTGTPLGTTPRLHLDAAMAG